MIIQLEPKKAFLKHDDLTKPYRAFVDSESFKEAVHLAISEYVIRWKPTTEQLEGVRQFLNVMLNMGEKEDPVQPPQIMQSIAQALSVQPTKK